MKAKKKAVAAAQLAVHQCEFLDKDVRNIMEDMDADQMRETAKTFDRWAAQLRFKADLLDGRMFEVTHWIKN